MEHLVQPQAAPFITSPRQWIRTSYFWIAGLSLTAVYFVLCVVMHVGSKIWPRELGDGKGVHRVASLWGRTAIKMMPGWKVEIAGWEHLPKANEPVVIVANHESMADIWAMYYLGIQFRWLSKDAVFKLPLIGRAMRWCEYISITRGSKASHIEAIRQSEIRIKKGIPMFFFPEGTRSEDGKVKEFKIGAFKLAMDTQVPILPIAIHGAGSLMRKGSGHPSLRAMVRMTILPQVPPPQKKDTKLEEYAENVRISIIDAHKSILKEERA